MNLHNKPYYDHLKEIEVDRGRDNIIRLYLLRKILFAKHSTPDLYLCLVEETFDLTKEEGFATAIPAPEDKDAPYYHEGLAFLTKYQLMPEDWQPNQK